MPPRKHKADTTSPDEAQAATPLKTDEVAHVNAPPTDLPDVPSELCGSFGCTLPAGHNMGNADVPANHRPPQPGDPSKESTMALAALNRIADMTDRLDSLVNASDALAGRVSNVEEWINPPDGPNQVDSLNALGRRLDAAERDHQARVSQLEESLDVHIGAFSDRMTLIQKQLADSGTTPAIYAAVWAVMKDVQGVGKHGQMDPRAGMGSYSFRRYDDLKRELGAACRTHGIMLQSEIMDVVNEHPFQDNRKTRVQVQMRYRFTSLVDGSAVAFESLGESIDTSDKASGKAMTMALKFALDQAFMLAAEDIEDPDATRPNEDDIPREQRQERRDTTEARREPHPTQADLAAAQRVEREYAVGDTVSVAGQTFVKHSEGPAIPNSAGYDPARARAEAAQRYAPSAPPPAADDSWDQGPPKDERTPQQKAQAAAEALGKPGMNLTKWTEITEHARKLELLEVPVTVNGSEMALKHYMVAVGRSL